MKRVNWLSLLFVGVALLLVACGDNTATINPTTAPAATSTRAITAVSTTTIATTTQVATTTAVPTSATTATTSAATTAVQYPLSITDGSGTSITVSKKVERIVCLTWECLDNMIALGFDSFATAEAYLSPAGQYSTKPELLANKLGSITKIGNGSGAIPDLEGITKYKPDLVISNLGDYREALKNVTPIYVQKQGNGYQSGIDSLRDIAKLTGRETQAETAIKNLQNKLNLYKAKSPNNKSIMLMRFYYFPPPVYSSRSVQGSLLGQLAKFPWDVASSTNVSFVDASFEKILDVDPDVIFYGQIGGDPTYSETFKKNQEQFEANPFWQQLKAVKNKQLYPVEVWQLAGGILAYQALLDTVMTKLYPDVFPKPLP
jgi:iron complex transport system substrate-binding protein